MPLTFARVCTCGTEKQVVKTRGKTYLRCSHCDSGCGRNNCPACKKAKPAQK